MRQGFIIILLVMIMIPLISTHAESTPADVAKVIILKGKVTGKMQEGEELITLKTGMSLKEGMSITTEDKSFCKIIFIDKSQMNIGPQSTIVIKTFPKDEAGVVNLVNGQIRSKVTKNYMDIKNKQQSKLFIRTRSAAMGVRGTDFQVNFNEDNKVTSLITFEGQVKMVKLDQNMDKFVKQADLDKMLNSKDAQSVTQGQYSRVNNESKKVTPPVKVSPAQLETLKNSTDNEKVIQGGDSSASTTPTKAVRSPIPPGVNSLAFSNNNNEALDKSVAQELGGAVVPQESPSVRSSDSSGSDIKPGGFVDLKTGLYVPPPQNSTFDSNTGVFVPPPTMGTFDQKTGGYLPPAGMELKPDGTFVQSANYVPPVKPAPDGRAPAGTRPNSPLPPPPTMKLDVSGNTGIMPEIRPMDVDILTADQGDKLEKIIDKTVDSTQDNLINVRPTSRVNINIK